MSKLNLLAGIAIAIIVSGSVYAAGPKGGGGGGRGGGGAPHVGGGGGAHFGGGGGMRGGGMRMGGARVSRRRGALFRRSTFLGRRRPSLQRQARDIIPVGGQSFVCNSQQSESGPMARSAAGQTSINNLNTGQNPTFRQNRNATLRANAVRSTLNSRSVAGALRNRSALHNPGARALIVASAATAGWHLGRDGNGWWRHGNGGYGWVGPLFWPFAYYDMYDYTLWGYGYDASFWDYGYNDIYAGLFAPYGYDDLAGYAAGSGGSAGRNRVRCRGQSGAGPVVANVRRRQPRHRRPSDRSDPGRHFA